MTDVFVRRVNHSEYRSSPQPKVPISVFSVPFYCAVMHWLSVATPVVLRCYRYSGEEALGTYGLCLIHPHPCLIPPLDHLIAQTLLPPKRLIHPHKTPSYTRSLEFPAFCTHPHEFASPHRLWLHLTRGTHGLFMHSLIYIAVPLMNV